MPTRWISRFFVAPFFALGLLANATAADFPPDSVPDPLKTWVPWVLDTVPDAGCPHLYNDAGQRYCAWPGALELKADGQGAEFSQDWQVFRETWITLPGNEKHWPQKLSIDTHAGSVLSRDGLPSIKLATGTHHIAGTFAWRELPESLALPPSAGLLRLEVNGQTVNLPVRDDNNQLWLQRKVETEGEENARVRVYRKISDGVPITVETRMQLEVSGKSREINIGRALLAELIPQSLNSPLPTALGADGSLKVQARAGTWEINFIARHPGPVQALSLPPGGGLTADEEIWVFQAAPLIRNVSIEDAPAVDPQQTTLPNEWRNLPSYLMRADAHFKFKELRRGDSEPAPDKLSLERRLWLSFDGRSMTASDRIGGDISRASRLSMRPPAVLGRVDIDGQDQLITRGGNQLAGIEVKRGKIAISADSLISDPSQTRHFAAVGWQHDFDHVAMQLALPAGWRLLHAAGVDRADGAWLSQWNLLDFFLVLVIALAAGQLWGRACGVLALAALVLSYQEPGAPTYEWLALLAAVALYRVLPAGRFRHGIGWFRRISLLAVVLISLGFATDQVRSALYPVLEGANRLMYEAAAPTFMPEQNGAENLADAETPLAAPTPAMNEPEAAAPMRSAKMLSRPTASMAAKRQDTYQTIDPDAKVQTGPGLPDWQWHNYRLQWDGPVRQDQSLDLWLLSPAANKALVLLRLGLLGLLLAIAAELPLPPPLRRRVTGKSTGLLARFRPVSMVLICLLALSAALHSPLAKAALPDQELLGELREKLSRPADCLPECAEISHLKVQIRDASLRLELTVDAAIDTALPLPGGARHWLPNTARIDGKTAYIQRNASGGLWLLTPAGRHQIELTGDLVSHDLLQLPLPRKPRQVEIDADGWDIAGLSDESGVADTLQLSRHIKAGTEKDGPRSSLPPFLRIERRLNLDLVWRVETIVRRDSPLGVPALVEIPLLPGEAVMTPGIEVRDGKVLLNLGPQADSLSWSSSLAQNETLDLHAANDSAWVETWVIASSARWHVGANGIPPVATDANEATETADLADLSFKPWPGETLTLKIERPPAIDGQTLTIDRSNLVIIPGTRATDYQLNLSLRSSRGTDHRLILPDGASLQRVTINGQVRPIRASGRQLLLPITPGKQVIDVDWRLDQGMRSSFATQPVDLGQPSVNSRIKLQIPHDRWLLLASGPGIGPAILFWGKLLVLLVVAFALGRFGGLPIPTRQWILLALGLTQVDWSAAAVVIGWFFAISLRGKSPADSSHRWLFNLRQLALGLLTLVFAGILFDAVQGGLLGHPDMQVAGNNSSFSQLNWYLDRAGQQLQSAWMLSLPILLYRGLMLAWALWLAWSLLAWLKWGWQAFGRGGLWRRKVKIVEPVTND